MAAPPQSQTTTGPSSRVKVHILFSIELLLRLALKQADELCDAALQQNSTFFDVDHAAPQHSLRTCMNDQPSASSMGRLSAMALLVLRCRLSDQLARHSSLIKKSCLSSLTALTSQLEATWALGLVPQQRQSLAL